MYFFSFNYDKYRLEQFYKYLIALSFAICIFFWVATTLILTGFIKPLADPRAVSAYISIFVCFSGLILLSQHLSNKTTRRDNYVLIFIVMTILFMMQRTVWLSFITGSLVVLLYNKKKIWKIVFKAGLAFIFGFAVLLSFPSISDKLLKNLDKSALAITDSDNFESSTGAFRIARWQSRIKSNFDYRVLLFGQGHGYKRTSTIKFGGRTAENSTSFHNQYLEQSFRIGVISVILLVAGLFLLIRTNRRLLPKDSAMAFNAIYFSVLVFGLSYNFPILFYFVLAINLSALYRPNKVPGKRIFLY
jgi:hypothetical protein